MRFVRTHGNVRQRLYFWLSTAYNVPLELLAAVLGREEELKLGALTYRSALATYCLEASGARSTNGIGRIARAVARAPVTLFWSLPADIQRARRGGLTAEVEACLRGHWDGWRDRPLPLEALGLRGPRSQSGAPG